MGKRRNSEKKDDDKHSKRLRTRAQHRKQTNQESAETTPDNPRSGTDAAAGTSNQAADAADSAAPPRADSPEPSCSICLGDVDNKSFTNSCFHTFCYVCLLEWSKVKPVCPLCKQPFKSIIHNVRSLDDYDEYTIPQEEPAAQRFRYRTTLTNDRWDNRAQDAQQRALASLQRPTRSSAQIDWRRRRQVSTSAFRKRIYNLGMRVQEVTTPAGQPVRYREISPAWFRRYPATTHRLVPWLNRELNVLLNNNDSQVTFLLELILDLIKRFDIQSPEFSQHINPFLRRRTDHFIHEFYMFARSPSDILSFDRNAIYHEPADANPIHTLPSSSSSSDSNDDDVIILPSDDTFQRPPQASGQLFQPSPSRSEPQSTRSGDPLSFSPILRRVHDFLQDHMPDRSWGSPTPGPSNFWSSSSFFTPSAPLTSIPTFDDLASIYPGASAASGSASSGQPVFQQRPDNARRRSSSHESDIEVVGEEKPWTERSPIAVLSSDTEPEVTVVDKRKAPKRHKDEKERKSKKKKKKRSRSRDRHSYSSRHDRDRRRDERLKRHSSQQSGSTRRRDRPSLLYRGRSVSRSREERSHSSTCDLKSSRDKSTSDSYKRSSAREFRSPDSGSRGERSSSRSPRHRRSRSKDTSRSSKYAKERHRDKNGRTDRSKSKSSAYSSTHDLTSPVRSVVFAPSKSTAPAPQEVPLDLCQGGPLDLRLQPQSSDENTESKSTQRDVAGSSRAQDKEIRNLRSRSRSPQIRKHRSRSRSKKKKKQKTRSRSRTPATERSGRFPEIHQRHKHKSKHRKSSKSKESEILLGRESRSSSVEVIFRKKHKSKKQKKHKRNKDSSVFVVSLLSSDEDEGINEKENETNRTNEKRKEQETSGAKQWKKNATGHKKSSAKKSDTTSGTSNQADQPTTSNDSHRQAVQPLDVLEVVTTFLTENNPVAVPSSLELGAEVALVDQPQDPTAQSPASVSSETTISSYHSDYSNPNSPKQSSGFAPPVCGRVVDVGDERGGSHDNPVMIDQDVTAGHSAAAHFSKNVVISSEVSDDDAQEVTSVNKARMNPYNWKNAMMKNWISSKHDFLPADDAEAQLMSGRSDGENAVNVDQNSQHSPGSSVIDVCTQSAASKDGNSPPIDVETTSNPGSESSEMEKKSKETMRSFMEQLHEVIAGTSSEHSCEKDGPKDELDVKEELKDFNPVIKDVKGGEEVKEEGKEIQEQEKTILTLTEDQMEVKSELRVGCEATETSKEDCASGMNANENESDVKNELGATESFGISDVRSMDRDEFSEQVPLKERVDCLEEHSLKEEPVVPGCSEVLEQAAEDPESSIWNVAGSSDRPEEIDVSQEEDETEETTGNSGPIGNDDDADDDGMSIKKDFCNPGSVRRTSEEISVSETAADDSVLHDSDDDVEDQTVDKKEHSSLSGVAELHDRPSEQDKRDETSSNDFNPTSSPSSDASKNELLGKTTDSTECRQSLLSCDNQKVLIDNCSNIVENGVSGDDDSFMRDEKKHDDYGQSDEQDDSVDVDKESSLNSEVASSSEAQIPVESVSKDSLSFCVDNLNESTNEDHNSMLVTETEGEMHNTLSEKDWRGDRASTLAMDVEFDVEPSRESDAQTERKSEESCNVDVHSIDNTHEVWNGKTLDEVSSSNFDTATSSVGKCVGASESENESKNRGSVDLPVDSELDCKTDNSLSNSVQFPNSEAEKHSNDLRVTCKETLAESKQTEDLTDDLSTEQLSKKIHDLENSAFPLATSAVHGDVAQL